MPPIPSAKVPFPYDSGNILKDLFFTWIFPLASYYSKNTPSSSNIFDLPNRLDYHKDLIKIKSHWKNEKTASKPNIFNSLWHVCRKEFIISILPAIISYNSYIITSLLLIYIVDYLNGKGGNIVAYIAAYSIILLYSSFSLNYSFRKILLLIAKLKAILSEILYEKVLNIHYSQINHGSLSGKFTSLISADLEFLEGLVYLKFLFILPLFMLGSGFLLWFNLGVSGIIGLLIALSHVILNFYLGQIFGRIRMVVASLGDTRMKMIGNIIEGINIIKAYAWEIPYLNLIFNKRQQEINKHKQKSLITCLNRAFNYGSMGLVLFITFTTHVYLGNELEASKVFSSISLLILNTSLINQIGAKVITQIFLVKSAMKRITESLMVEEKYIRVLEDCFEDYDIIAQDCKFSWELEKTRDKVNDSERLETRTESKFRIKNLKFKVKKGELVFVIGTVGSGKSGLILGLLQELTLCKGKLQCHGQLSYTSEKPWIIPGTIKENILMGREFLPNLYQQVLESCSLLKDLENFQELGDLTIVGDNGITLSGGQKARISLARAIYSEADIYLFDDPLSAVDPQVSSEIFENLIKRYLNGKTVILATHQTQYLSRADKILVLAEGKQVFFGSFPEFNKQGFEGYVGVSKDKLNNDEKEVGNIESSEKFKVSSKNEETAKGHVPFKAYWEFIILGYQNGVNVAFVFLLQIIGQTFYLAVIYWIVYWAKSNNQDSSFFIYTMSGLVVILYIITFIRVLSLVYPFFSAVNKLHNLAIKGLTFTSSIFFDENPTGRILNRFSKDVSQTDEILLMFIIDLVFYFTLVFGNLIVIIIISYYLLIPFTLMIIYFIIFIKIFNSASKDLKRFELLSKSPIISQLNNTVHGISTIRCLNLVDLHREQMSKKIEINYKAYIAFQLVFRMMQTYLELGPSIMSVINLIVLVLIKDQLNPGLAAMSISLSITIMGLIGYLFKAMLETDNYMTSIQRLLEYSNLPKEEVISDQSELIVTKGEIIFSNLYLKYNPTSPYALKNVSFCINPCSTTGIIGRTGSGKSSILQVLLRLTAPEQGTVYIDGQDYLKVTINSIRKQISVIPQSATIFLTSLRQNIDPFGEHSDLEIKNVLKEVKLEEFVEKIGNENFICQGNLSSGQKQLICMARAILRNSKIVVMDEATANVDFETEKTIEKAVKKRFSKTSLVVIAHRIRNICEAHWVIIMDNGVVVEEGCPKDLLTKSSVFSSLIDASGLSKSRSIKKNKKK